MNIKFLIPLLIAYAICQVGMFTFFKLAKFGGFTVPNLLHLLSDIYFLLGVLLAGGILVGSLLLVKIAETSAFLVMLLYLNGFLVCFILLPLTWRTFFGEQIFTSMVRVYAFIIALVCALGLIYAMYLWNK